MTGMFLAGGKRAMIRMLAGECLPINGMYAEYGADRKISATPKSFNYFSRLLSDEDPSRGFARIAVSGHEVDELTASATFTGLLVDTDFGLKTPPPGSMINAVTLCHMRNNDAADDILIYTLILPEPVRITEGALTTIRTTLSFGVTNG